MASKLCSVSGLWCPPCPAVCGACRDFLIPLKLQKSARCSELGSRINLKLSLAPLQVHWNLSASSETWKCSFGCLKSKTEINAGKELSEAQRPGLSWNSLNTSLAFLSINQAPILSMDQNQHVCHQTFVLTSLIFPAQHTKSNLDVTYVSYWTGKEHYKCSGLKGWPSLCLIAFCDLLRWPKQGMASFGNIILTDQLL